jgi:glucose/arabinose dehydrogenase
MFFNLPRSFRYWLLIQLLILLSYCTTEPEKSRGQVFQSEEYDFTIDTIAMNLKTVFGMDWLPDGKAIFTERGRHDSSISVIDIETGRITRLCNVPPVYSEGDAGMLDIRVHPNYSANGWIYFAYCILKRDSTSTLVVDRAKLDRNCLRDIQRLFEVKPYFKSSGHFGCRMQLRDGYLFLSMGERFVARDSAQNLSNHFGKIIRLHDDGRVPTDNPYVKTKSSLPEIWSYGHRNPQGMSFHPITGDLWISEHGPQGGDEINIVKPGHNYGWPIITYGEEYGGGKIGAGITHKDGMEQPVYYYVPSIAPGGMMIYSGKAFPKWKNNIFSGALALRHLNRAVIENNTVVKEERILGQQKWRVRMVNQGPDGFIYFSVDKGMILRLRPV